MACWGLEPVWSGAEATGYDVEPQDVRTGLLAVGRLLLGGEAVGKRFGGVDISNGDEERAQAIALRRHAEG